MFRTAKRPPFGGRFDQSAVGGGTPTGKPLRELAASVLLGDEADLAAADAQIVQVAIAELRKLADRCAVAVPVAEALCDGVDGQHDKLLVQCGKTLTQRRIKCVRRVIASSFCCTAYTLRPLG